MFSEPSFWSSLGALSFTSLRLLASLTLALAFWLGAGAARAQANYDGVKLGGRTAIMGGAAVARGSDGATAFVNPARITLIPGESFSFSTFALEAGGRKIGDQLDPDGTLGVPTEVPSTLNARILPNTFCLFLDGPPKDHYSGRSRHKYGVCGADTESEELLVTQNGQGQNLGTIAAVSEQTRMKWARSSLAAAWGFEIERGLSIGVTARIENSRLEDTTMVTAMSGNATASSSETLNRAIQASSWDSFVVVGLSYQVVPFMTLGASLSTPSQHILGFYSASETFIPGGSTSTLVQDDGDFRYNLPTNLRLGLAFTWPRLSFEVNGSFYGGASDLASAVFDRSSLLSTDAGAARRDARAAINEIGKPVTNVLAGAELFVDSDFSVLFGVQTDFTGLVSRTDARAANTLFRQAKDAVHFSVGAATYGSAGSLLLGLRAFVASGDVLLGNPSSGRPELKALPQSEWGLSLVVSGQISFESVRDTAARAAAPLQNIPKALEKEPSGDEQTGGKSGGEEDDASDADEGSEP